MSIVCDRESVEARLASGEFFWLDLYPPGPDEYAVLRNVFLFHPLAVEDSEHFGQRAKLEEYDDFVFLVLYGAAPDEDQLVEVHCFYSERFLVTVRRDQAPALEALKRRFDAGRGPQRAIELLHRVLDTLVDSFFPALADYDDRLERVQEALLQAPGTDQLQELHAMRRQLIALRRAIVPQRDLVGRLELLPGMTTEDERYFRDVHDHLFRLVEQIDSYRDLIAETMDLYISTTSNRLNEVMKQLAVIATIFLPLTFITGFFGQNFPWLVDHIGGWGWFVALGLGLEVAAVLGLLGYFKRRGWF